MILPVRNFQELLTALPTLGYSANTQAQIRPEIIRAEKIYNRPLSDIPLSSSDFERRWGRGQIAAIPAGFKDHKQFSNFRKRLSAAIGKVERGGATKTSCVTPAWQSVLEFLKQEGGVCRRVPAHLDASIGVIARVASLASIEPCDLNDAHVATLGDALKGSNRRSYRRGIDSINSLIAKAQALPEIASYLPENQLAPPPLKQNPSSHLRRGSQAPEAQQIWRDFENFATKKRGVDSLGRAIQPAHSEFSEKTEKSYADALQQALNILTKYHEIRPDEAPRLRDICNADQIQRIACHWNTRQINGEVKKEGSALHTLVCRLSHIAVVMGAKKKEQKALATLRKKVKKAGKTIGKMMPERVEWVQNFASSPALQRAVFLMPETLMREANIVLKDWETLKKKRRHKVMMDALKMGITAAISAILYRGAPIRAANLRNLKFRGDDANLYGDHRAPLRIVIAAADVKNNKRIDQVGDDDAWPILDWYLREIRPKIIHQHPYGAQIVDSDFLFPSTKADRALEETTLAGHYQRGCELSGVDLTFHLARHITAFVILNENPNAWGEAAAVLDDEISTVEKHYAWLDTMKASAEGRKLMNQARKAANKHKKGYSNAE